MEQIKIGNDIFTVTVVTSQEAMTQGLGGTDSLEKGTGMLFDFGKASEITMNMMKMKYSLDMIFIGEDDKVIKVVSMEPGENEVTVPNVRYVVEVNKGEGAGKVKPKEELEEEVNDNMKNEDESQNMIVNSKNISGSIQEKFQAGGSFKLYEEEVKALPGSMHVLDDTGKVLMNITGGERIFSIGHTEKLIAGAKKVKAGELPPEELGKIMANIIQIQNTQKPEYVN